MHSEVTSEKDIQFTRARPRTIKTFVFVLRRTVLFASTEYTNNVVEWTGDS